MCTKEKHRKSATSKTHEQYIEEVKKLNPDIKVIGKYINANKAIKHYCRKHNIYWDITPSNILKGCGCAECGNEKIKYKNRKSHEEYVKEVSLISPHIEVLEKYVDMKTSVLHKCNIHNIQWKTMPESILQGCGCPECGKEKSRSALCKSNEEYVEELKKKNSNIIAKEIYINSNTSILHKCLIDGYEWKARPANILSGMGCPKCAIEKNRKSALRTHQQYIEEVNKVHPYIEVMEEYKCSGTAIKHYCKKHNIYWDAVPSNILKGCGCLKCGIEKRNIKSRKSHNKYVEEVNLINPHIIVLDKYVNAQTFIKHKCTVDGYEWFAKPYNILHGKGCPICNESHGERQIRLWLEKHNIKYISQKKFDDCKDKKPLPFDFYLPDNIMCIEYDGEQHIRPIDYFGGTESYERTVKHDNIKNEYCKNNGISLLRIPYTKNVEEELDNFLFI